MADQYATSMAAYRVKNGTVDFHHSAGYCAAQSEPEALEGGSLGPRKETPRRSRPVQRLGGGAASYDAPPCIGPLPEARTG